MFNYNYEKEVMFCVYEEEENRDCLRTASWRVFRNLYSNKRQL